MTTLFDIGNALVMPGWLLLILAPRWRWTMRLMARPWIALLPALLYAAVLLPQAAGVLPAVAKPELATIAGMLGTPEGATIAWQHFLALDLLLGWVVWRDAMAREVRQALLAPVLVLCLMFAPLGLLLWQGMRAAGAWGRDSGAESGHGESSPAT